jgi:hypothetical protein
MFARVAGPAAGDLGMLGWVRGIPGSAQEHARPAEQPPQIGGDVDQVRVHVDPQAVAQGAADEPGQVGDQRRFPTDELDHFHADRSCLIDDLFPVAGGHRSPAAMGAALRVAVDAFELAESRDFQFQE